MLSANKDMKENIKDPERKLSASYGAGTENMSITLSYTKTNKLITALYMVTDIIDKDEPIRNKLRSLGAEIISDPERIRPEVRSYGAGMSMRIEQIIAFLNISSAMNFISEMNCNILKKEFIELKASIQEGMNMKPTWLAEFFEVPPLLDKEGAGGGNSRITTSPSGHSSSTRRRGISKGHTRLGVQKGSTLMDALSGVEMSNRKLDHISHNVFNELKKERRNFITNTIKNSGGNISIKDILTKMNAVEKNELSFSEKTLQRELVSMTKDGILNKAGEKRWSRYSVK